jgi:hypothetical protein
MRGSPVGSLAVEDAPERSFGGGRALDDKRVPGPASRCALQQACAALGQQAGLGALAENLQSMSQDIGTRHRHRRLRAASGHWQ